MLLAAPATLWRRIADCRRDIALVLEALEGLVDGAKRDVALRALRNLAADADAIGAVAEPHQREQDDLLEFADRGDEWSRRSGRHGLLRRSRGYRRFHERQP